MFTGIIQHVGRVATVVPNDIGIRLAIDASGWGHRPTIGESISVDGCCLTYALDDRGRLGFDVVQQTLNLTTLGNLRPGARVNLEHAVTPATLMGGHIVQGHVDGVGRIVHVKRDAAQHRLAIQAPAPLAAFIVSQGSIAVNGVSLTVAGIERDWFEVALIPTTVERTNLGELREGDQVNLEADYLAKIAVQHLRRIDSTLRKTE